MRLHKKLFTVTLLKIDTDVQGTENAKGKLFITYTGSDNEALQRPTEPERTNSTILNIAFQGNLFRNDGFETGCNVRRDCGVFYIPWNCSQRAKTPAIVLKGGVPV